MKDKRLKDVCEEYIKRIRTFAKLNIFEVAASSSFSEGDKKRVQKEEEERIDKMLKKGGGRVFLLSEDGLEYNSPDFAMLLTQKSEEITFIIGGSFGFSEDYKKKHDLCSLSLLTFPHELARIILVEQLYRATTLNQKSNKYHK